MGDKSPTSQIETSVSSPSGEAFFIQKSINVPQIVLTGGPACGKTTALNYLKTTRPDLNFIEEAATQVLSGGFPIPTESRPWSQAWQNGLQLAIAGHQLGLETIEHPHTIKGIIQDRGLLDGAAYLPRGISQLEELTRLTKQEMLGRYHAVIYLGWMTNRVYSSESNPHRFEDEARAKQLSEEVLKSWEGHPRIIEITIQNDRAKYIAEIIEDLLPS